MSSDLRVPHFLRVTQALALVSGLGLSGCSGSVTTTSGGSDANAAEGALYYEGGTSTDVGPLGIGLYEGGPMGVVVGGGVQPYDGGSSGADSAMAIYEGGLMGVRPFDGGPFGIGIAPDGGILVGGPLIAPELPA